MTALAPSSSLTEKDAIAQWEQALLHLRRDASARPKQVTLQPPSLPGTFSNNRDLDVLWRTHGHIFSLFSLRLHYSPHSPWQLSPRKGPTIRQYQPFAFGLRWPFRPLPRGTQVYLFTPNTNFIQKKKCLILFGIKRYHQGPLHQHLPHPRGYSPKHSPPAPAPPSDIFRSSPIITATGLCFSQPDIQGCQLWLLPNSQAPASPQSIAFLSQEQFV